MMSIIQCVRVKGVNHTSASTKLSGSKRLTVSITSDPLRAKTSYSLASILR